MLFVDGAFAIDVVKISRYRQKRCETGIAVVGVDVQADQIVLVVMNGIAPDRLAAGKPE